ncbi:MAG TPA: ABC transporter ATP-binding protein [bacterium]|nr:ABC transporter ATP-binding protein [bacterium]
MKVLEINNLKKSYLSPEGERHLVVNTHHFSLGAGDQTALAGESGSGKTTFLNLIAGILKPDEGDITLAGKPLGPLSEGERDLVRAQTLGYIFQTFNLLQGYTALENVKLGMMFGRGVDEAYATDLLERVGLKNRLHYYPRQMSVGQQQRVAVARALANHPKLVLADEPTGHLDPVRAMESLELIRKICRENGAALLLVSHDREVLAKFDRVENLGRINRIPTAAGRGRSRK